MDSRSTLGSFSDQLDMLGIGPRQGLDMELVDAYLELDLVTAAPAATAASPARPSPAMVAAQAATKPRRVQPTATHHPVVLSSHVAAVSAAGHAMKPSLTSPKKLKHRRTRPFDQYVTTFQKSDPKPAHVPPTLKHIDDGLGTFQLAVKPTSSASSCSSGSLGSSGLRLSTNPSSATSAHSRTHSR